eukprot:224168_1
MFVINRYFNCKMSYWHKHRKKINFIGGRIDSNGKRIKKETEYIYSDDQVIQLIENLCDNREIYPGKKQRKMCNHFVESVEEPLIETMRKYEPASMRRFCRKHISKQHCK